MSFRAVLVLFAFTSSLVYGGERDFRVQKIQYARTMEAGLEDFLKAMDLEKERISTDGNLQLDQLSKLRDHRGRILLGVEGPEALLEDSSLSLSPEFRTAVQSYAEIVKNSRQEMEAQYQELFDDFSSDIDTRKAELLKKEFEAFRNGSYSPTPFEILPDKPYQVVKTVLEKRAYVPMSSRALPDELYLEHHVGRFRIHGKCRHDYFKIDGDRCGHFGKLVVLETGRSRLLKMSGFFAIADRDREGYYGIAMVKGGKFERVLHVEDLDIKTMYEWKVTAENKDLKFEILKDGQPVKFTVVKRIPGASVAFYATSRFVNEDADITVAYE